MPQGLIDGPAIFFWLMNCILSRYERIFYSMGDVFGFNMSFDELSPRYEAADKGCENEGLFLMQCRL